MLDMARAKEIFDASEDFTVGIEEEFGIRDPESHALVQRFEELSDAAQADDDLGPRVAGELISSEIEIRSAKGRSFSDALASQRDARARLFRLAADRGALLSATGTHPWSPWWEQRIIETEHYQRLVRDLGYVARRNNTFSVHVHVGIRGADRAIAVCDRLRPVLPQLLAISANSPFLDGYDSGLHSARSQIFTKSFPRCGIPEPFGDWRTYADHVEFLIRTHSILEHTQLWWSIRPHHTFGTVELRICDAQTSAEAANALEALAVACIAQAALDQDEGVPFDDLSGRMIDEAFWRAMRYGLEGQTLDLARREEFAAAEIPERLMSWTASARAELGLDPAIADRDGAQRQREALEAGATIREIFSSEVAETQRSYAAQGVTT
jgi:carboxylate-amine ligase